MNVGIVGYGFVGKAMGHVHAGHRFYDPHVAGGVASLRELSDWADVLYICVSTPMGEGGACDESAVRETMQHLVRRDYQGLVICKSTFTYSVYEDSKGLCVCFIPEFLRGASAIVDYLETKYFVVGVDSAEAFQAYLKTIELSSLPHKVSMEFYPITIKEAVCLKYFENTYLATKVTLFNEFYLYCKGIGVSYDKVINALTVDPRICPDHTKVPGPDGKFGWGGHCLPKDLNALAAQAKQVGVPMPLLRTIITLNETHRALAE